jgi:hypothetical protein
MARVHIYRTYRWTTKDPIIDAVRQVVKGEEHLKNSHVHELSGVATATLDNWFDGGTKKPQNSTICAVTAALGYVRRDRLERDGTVTPAFVKARAIDYVKAREAQADWILKHADPNKKKKPGKRKRKVNGNAAP